MPKKISPQISKYFSELAKKRTDNNRGFANPEVARLAQQKSVESKKIAKEKAKQDTPTQEDLRPM